MMLHFVEFAVSSWLAFYAANVFGRGLMFQLGAWALFFGILLVADKLGADD